MNTGILSDKWNITANRFVAFFDILGFKDRVMRESHQAIYKDLSEIQINENILSEVLVDTTIKKYFGNVDVCVVKFSDSIVLFSKNDSIEDFTLFLISARFLFHSFLKKDFLIKGGMAYGDISLDRDKQLYFGQPIIDAYLLEEDVNYIGVAAHNTIDIYRQKIEKDNKFYLLLSQLICDGKTPLKSGFITHSNLNWFPKLVGNENLEGKIREDIVNEIITNLKKYYLNVAGSPRRYIDNTIDFLNKNQDINFDKIVLPTTK
ncbi:hypothetical protein AGMMS49574_08970 [Bacteroidia bacterium]|nr:hypothetical protein AGMMS49574_08970 [Bacteroidia bacterium]